MNTSPNRRKKGGGTFFGEPTISGKQGQLGFYQRPKRVKKGGRWVNEHAPVS
jgi:hypothetical protein